jgi:4'-phosphopantetheinyl transferase
MMIVFWLEQVAGDVPLNDNWLSTSERGTLAGMKVPKRRADWRLGRWTAKQAASLQLAPDHNSLAAIEVLPAASGAPEVFLHHQPAPVSISLSHSNGVAACAVAPAGSFVGCDLEVIEPRSDAFLADYFTAAEQQIIAGSSDALRDLVVTALWSAKESALKAMREGLRLDTRAVSVWLENATLENREDARSLAEWRELRVTHENKTVFAGWWRSADCLVRTLVSIPSAVPPIPLKIISLQTADAQAPGAPRERNVQFCSDTTLA